MLGRLTNAGHDLLSGSGVQCAQSRAYKCNVHTSIDIYLVGLVHWYFCYIQTPQMDSLPVRDNGINHLTQRNCRPELTIKIPHGVLPRHKRAHKKIRPFPPLLGASKPLRLTARVERGILDYRYFG